MSTVLELRSTTPDFTAVKQRQQATWASGDFAVIGTTLQIVGESLAEAVDVRAGERVLDVAAGNGNATLAAARRFAQVTSTDYVPALLDKGRERAQAEGLAIRFQAADAEDLPFDNGSFDVVLSTFGAMFTPEHSCPAREMLRVLRGGGRIGLANWTPEGFIGRLFKVIGAYVPPPAGLISPAGPLKGVAAISGLFKAMLEEFGKPGARFSLKHLSVAETMVTFCGRRRLLTTCTSRARTRSSCRRGKLWLSHSPERSCPRDENALSFGEGGRCPYKRPRPLRTGISS